MEVEKQTNQIIANLNQADIFNLQKGNSVYADRPGVTTPDAFFQVSPLSDLEIDNSAEFDPQIDRIEKAKVKGILHPNDDLQIYISAAVALDLRINSILLPRADIVTTAEHNGKDFIEKMIPPEGIELKFAGRLKTVHVADFFA